MATLGDVLSFRRPIGSQFTGRIGELGPEYSTPGGSTFQTFRASPQTEQERASEYMGQVLGMGQPDPRAQAMRMGDVVGPNPERSRLTAGDVGRGASGVVRALMEGAWQGISAPGRAARGEPVTYGDAWATALDYGAVGNLASAPEGALRANNFRAYHGSPHDFDRFDISKIGTGEGAQAYGHGLYFAESEDVARGYRDRLTNPDISRSGLYSGPDISDEILPGRAGFLVRGALGQFYQRKVDDAISALRSNRDYVVNDDMLPAYDEAIAFLEQADRVPDFDTGRLYEVQINADPETFLDWDAPLSQQPQAVREWALDNMTTRGWQGDTVPVREVVNQYSEHGMNPWVDGGGIPEVRKRGDEIYYEVASSRVPREIYGRGRLGATETSQRLRDAGIPGIRYLDAGSRGAGTGTRNFVIFDDSIIDIIRKYGVAAAAPMLGMTVAQLEAEMQAQGVGDGNDS